MVCGKNNLSDDCFEEMLVYQLNSSTSDKIKKAVYNYLDELENEKVCEYDPAEFNKDPRPLGRWDRLIAEQNIRIDTVKKIIALINRIT